MYDGKASGSAGSVEYIQILARRVSIAFAGFVAVNAWLIQTPGWYSVGALAIGYVLYNGWLCRLRRLPSVGELFCNLVFCAGLTWLQAEFSPILYHLLLLRTCLRVGRRRTVRVTALVVLVYLAATAPRGIGLDSATLMKVLFDVLGLGLVAYTAACLDQLMAKQVKDDKQMMDLIQQNDRNYRLALTDALTGLYNHRAYKEKIDGIAKYVLLIIDIDHFKKLNDAYGHLAGDRVLVTLGNIIKLSVRSGDQAFRYGGEEFVVVLPGETLATAFKIADRLRQKVANWNFECGAGRIPVTVSVGLAVKHAGMDSQTVFAEADRALYRAKQLGRNNVQAAAKPGVEAAVN